MFRNIGDLIVKLSNLLYIIYSKDWERICDYMEKVIIRKATIEDLSSIQELNNSLFELEYENFDDT